MGWWSEIRKAVRVPVWPWHACWCPRAPQQRGCASAPSSSGSLFSHGSGGLGVCGQGVSRALLPLPSSRGCRRLSVFLDLLLGIRVAFAFQLWITLLLWVYRSLFKSQLFTLLDVHPASHLPVWGTAMPSPTVAAHAYITSICVCELTLHSRMSPIW